MSTPFAPAAALLVALAVGACSGAASADRAAPRARPVRRPAAAPPRRSIAGHRPPDRRDDIVLRLDEAGGFVPVEFLAARVPYFTLYGDGRVVFVAVDRRRPSRTTTASAAASPLRTGVLTEEQVQDLLEFALADGGLAVARDEYQNPIVADAPTAVFTINADDDSKTVSVVALGMEDAARPRHRDQARRWPSSASGCATSTTAARSRATRTRPPAYRGVLTDASGASRASRSATGRGTTSRSTTSPSPPTRTCSSRARAVLTPEQVGRARGRRLRERDPGRALRAPGPTASRTRWCIRPLLPDETRSASGRLAGVSSRPRTAPRRSSRTASAPS